MLRPRPAGAGSSPATGVQLADEIHWSVRPVTLAVGEHIRLPRTYRGRDIFWWMEATGLLAERYDQIEDLTRARHLPSPQLIGTPERTTTDLNTLAGQGVRIVVRLGRVMDGVAQFSGSLANMCALADLKMNRFLDRADPWATTYGLDDELPPPHRFAATRIDPHSPLELDLSSGRSPRCCGRRGLRSDLSWLDIPVRDRAGRICHDGGVVTGVPGLYVLGMPVLCTRAPSPHASPAACAHAPPYPASPTAQAHRASACPEIPADPQLLPCSAPSNLATKPSHAPIGHPPRRWAGPSPYRTFGAFITRDDQSPRGSSGGAVSPARCRRPGRAGSASTRRLR